MKITRFLALTVAIIPAVALADVSGSYSKKNAAAELKQQGKAVEFSINSSVGRNMCELEGVASMIDENRAAFSPSDKSDKCVAVLNFTGGQLKVTTKDCDSYCGLNAAGSMDGQYKKKK